MSNFGQKTSNLREDPKEHYKLIRKTRNRLKLTFKNESGLNRFLERKKTLHKLRNVSWVEHLEDGRVIAHLFYKAGKKVRMQEFDCAEWSNYLDSVDIEPTNFNAKPQPNDKLSVAINAVSSETRNISPSSKWDHEEDALVDLGPNLLKNESRFKEKKLQSERFKASNFTFLVKKIKNLEDQFINFASIAKEALPDICETDVWKKFQQNTFSHEAKMSFHFSLDHIKDLIEEHNLDYNLILEVYDEEEGWEYFVKKNKVIIESMLENNKLVRPINILLASSAASVSSESGIRTPRQYDKAFDLDNPHPRVENESILSNQIIIEEQNPKTEQEKIKDMAASMANLIPFPKSDKASEQPAAVNDFDNINLNKETHNILNLQEIKDVDESDEKPLLTNMKQQNFLLTLKREFDGVRESLFPFIPTKTVKETLIVLSKNNLWSKDIPDLKFVCKYMETNKFCVKETYKSLAQKDSIKWPNLFKKYKFVFAAKEVEMVKCKKLVNTQAKQDSSRRTRSAKSDNSAETPRSEGIARFVNNGQIKPFYV